MGELVNIWKNNPSFFSGKKLSQIIAIAGDGNIENEKTYIQTRELFDAVPSEVIKGYVEECLTGFDKSGFVLQDLVNEIGKRIGFNVEHGLFRGSPKKNGMDGLWQYSDGAIIVEVKTTDAYRINLETLNKYKSMLIGDRPKLSSSTSILIVAGRQDTGDLEAQIRGSRYAWDIRLISIDSLIKLMDLKETLNDIKTITQINQVLLPREYTRLDKLIDLIFLSAQDAELDISDTEEACEHSSESSKELPTDKAGFYGDCAKQLSERFNVDFQKKAKTLYAHKDEIGVIINVSKQHTQGGRPRFWFAFHPYYTDNLTSYNQKFILYGCGTASSSFLLPLELIISSTPHMWHTTRKDGSVYWHINIFKEKNGKYYLQIPVDAKDTLICIDSYRL